MADKGDIKEQEKQENPKAEKTDKKTSIRRFLPWIILGAIVVVSAGAGFGLGRLFAGIGKDKATEPSPQNQQTEAENIKADTSAKGTQKIWYYDLEPVIANLDEPNVTRYVRAVLTLEMSPEMDEKKGKDFLDEKKPILTNWLAIYLASLSLENIRGERNLKSIQAQILDVFNEKLFPDSKPQIKHVLFREFAIQ
jgi:flagellar basal body-associated protein FliL